MADFREYLAQKAIQKAGERGEALIGQLETAVRAQNHVEVGRLCRELSASPFLLVAVVSELIKMVIIGKDRVGDGSERMLRPQDIGVDPNLKPELWLTALNDQMAAASKESDFNQFGALALLAWKRIIIRDWDTYTQEQGHVPDTTALMVGGGMLEHGTLLAAAAEAVRILILQEIGGG